MLVPMQTDDRPAKRYGQYCALARSLDRVGDRWTLLVVRELLARPARFGVLAQGLPGIATNLLSDRLRRLEHDGIVERRVADRGTGVVYALSPLGEQLRETVASLIRWGAVWMIEGRGDDACEPHWLSVAIPALVRPGARPKRTVRIQLPESTFELRGGRFGLRVVDELSEPVDATLVASVEAVLGIAAGHLDLAEALDAGVVEISGDRHAVGELLARRVGGGA